MSFDYFYGQQSDLFTFYRVPKVLFTNERFWNISADAKMLYGILLDRMSLSAKNGWIDKNGRVYIIFTIDEAKMALNCAEQKAIKLLSELEKKAGLIERKRQGLGKPNLIYVKNFISAVDSQLLNCENHNSGTMEITTQELPKSQCNNSPSYGLNYQKLGKDLASVDELAVLDGSKCILQLRGVRPFLSDKYDLTQHPNYKYTSDFDKRNEFNIEQFLSRRLKLKAGDEFVVVDAD